MKKWKQRLAVVMSAAVLGTVFAGTAFASEDRTAITSIDITIESDIVVGDDDDGSVSVTVNDDNYSCDDVEITNDDGDWEVGDKPKIEITLVADDDYYFKSMSSSKVKLRGDDATYSSSKREDDYETLILVVVLDALEGSLELDSVEWEDDNSPIAVWEDEEGAYKYYVRLYRSSSSVTEQLTTTNTYYDFSSYITRTGDFYFKVRAVSSDGDKGEWYESDYLYVDDDLLEDITSGNYSGSTSYSSSSSSSSSSLPAITPSTPNPNSGSWVTDSVGVWYSRADGTWPSNGWAQIDGGWYYFNASGYIQTGWILASDGWYYCANATDAVTYSVNFGQMLSSCVTPDGYTVNENGLWVQ